MILLRRTQIFFLRSIFPDSSVILHGTGTWSMVTYTKDTETRIKFFSFLLQFKHFLAAKEERINRFDEWFLGGGRLVCANAVRGQQCPWMLNDDHESNAFLKIQFKSYSMRANNSDLSTRHAPTPQEAWKGAWGVRMIMSSRRSVYSLNIVSHTEHPNKEEG